MHTLLLITHVVAMIGSLALLTGAVALGLYGKRIAATLSTSGTVLAAAGGLTGTLLLLGGPLTIQCAMLTAYLIGVTALYVFGFDMGNADDARLIRSSVQNR